MWGLGFNLQYLKKKCFLLLIYLIFMRTCEVEAIISPLSTAAFLFFEGREVTNLGVMPLVRS